MDEVLKHQSGIRCQSYLWTCQKYIIFLPFLRNDGLAVMR